jgi:hypothetical protein
MENLNHKIDEQNKRIQEIIDQEKFYQNQISNQIDQEMSKIIQSIKNLNQINSKKVNNPLSFGLSHKITEFNIKIAQNTEKIKKNNENIPEIMRKKKESDEFFQKFMGEKKVWLDRLSETKTQKLTNEKSFKYLYEAKTIKLLLEGILLEKAEDDIESELAKKGSSFNWEVMDIQKTEEDRKKKEFDQLLKLSKISNTDEAINKEREYKEQNEMEENDRKNKINTFRKEWQELWGEIWIPQIPYQGDDTLVEKRIFIQKVILDVIFKLFKTKMYDVWKFKNILNNMDQYIILEKIKKYLNEANDNNGLNININNINYNHSRKDEDAFQKMTNIIEGIRLEQDIIYCDLTPAKKKLEMIINSAGGNNNSSAERISTLINKIEEFQSKAEKDPSVLLKREAEEINILIKNIPDENDRKLFQDNLKDSSRLYDVFLPLTTLLMIMTYLSVGKKRSSNYGKKLDDIKEENEKLQLEIEEIKGKLITLEEFNNKIKDEEKDAEDENVFNQHKDSLNQLTQLFMTQNDDIKKQNNQLFDDIKSNLVQPEI